MSDLDLNIYSYSFEDLLSIFGLSIPDEKDGYDRCKEKVERKIRLVEDRVDDPDILNFYRQTRKILFTVYHLLDNDRIVPNEIGSVVRKIKDTDDFVLLNEDELGNKVLNRPNYNTRVIHPIVKDMKTNVVADTFVNAVAPGVLNPVKRVTQIQNLNLNTCFRHNYYQSNPSNFLYLLPVEIKNVVSMRLVSIELPNSWYLFSSAQHNNVFFIESGGTTFKIVIPDGNYDMDTLQTFLNTTYFDESGTDTALKSLHFSIDRQNFKSRFEVLAEEGGEFHFRFVQEISQNIMNTAGWILGFRLGLYPRISEVLVSEGLFDAGGDRYVFVVLNDYQYNNNTQNTVCFDQSVLNEDVLAKIPMVNGKLSLVVNDNHCPLSKVRQYTGPVNISKLQIKLLDKFGTPIDLNNMDYSLTVELEILYESFNFSHVST